MKFKELVQNGEKSKRISPFQRGVYEAICDIPEGKVTTYKLLANYLNCRSAQAVGQALKRNPYAPTVPCHRVVSSDLSIGGFSGQRSGEKIHKKIQLLQEEGVEFDGTRIKEECVFRFSN